MPLGLSRQLLLDQWNEAIAFVSSALDARLATGNAHAGVHVLRDPADCAVLLSSASAVHLQAHACHASCTCKARADRDEPCRRHCRESCTQDPKMYRKHCQEWHPCLCAGLVEGDLEPLQLSKDQRSALLVMLRQSKRMRLVMRDNKHTYVLPQ